MKTNMEGNIGGGHRTFASQAVILSLVEIKAQYVVKVAITSTAASFMSPTFAIQLTDVGIAD
jgi:hypothetical protein